MHRKQENNNKRNFIFFLYRSLRPCIGSVTDSGFLNSGGTIYKIVVYNFLYYENFEWFYHFQYQ